MKKKLTHYMTIKWHLNVTALKEAAEAAESAEAAEAVEIAEGSIAITS